MTQDAPLLLLFDKAIDEVSRQLDAYVDGTNEVSSTHNKFGSSASASLLFNGLVFSARIVDPVADYTQYKKIFCNIDNAKMSAALALDLGDNIKGGETIAPIIKGLIALARRLGQGSGAIAAAWRPAMVLSDFGYFAQAVASYEEDGVFPVLALVDFQLTDTNAISSKGLAFLSTQEVILTMNEFSLGEATRRMVRIVHDIATNGPVTEPLEVEGLSAQEIIKLRPSAPQ